MILTSDQTITGPIVWNRFNHFNRRLWINRQNKFNNCKHHFTYYSKRWKRKLIPTINQNKISFQKMKNMMIKNLFKSCKKMRFIALLMENLEWGAKAKISNFPFLVSLNKKFKENNQINMLIEKNIYLVNNIDNFFYHWIFKIILQ